MCFLKETIQSKIQMELSPRSFFHRERATSIGWSYKVSLSCIEPGYCIFRGSGYSTHSNLLPTVVIWGLGVSGADEHNFFQSSFVITPTIFKCTAIWQHPAVGSALTHPAAWIWHPKLSTRQSQWRASVCYVTILSGSRTLVIGE